MSRTAISPLSPAAEIFLPNAPTLVVGIRRAAWLEPDGVIETLNLLEAQERVTHGPPVLYCHGRSLMERLNLPRLRGFDLLELFAFVSPAQFCAPSPIGLAQALGLKIPDNLEDQTVTLLDAAAWLMRAVQRPEASQQSDARAIADVMGLQGRPEGWLWSPYILKSLGGAPSRDEARAGLEIWRALPEWGEEAPPQPPGNQPISETETRERLHHLLQRGKTASEDRTAQSDYSAALNMAFQPRQRDDSPELILAEAGTGVGKTLGYLAPASVWAEKNRWPVWISTFTRNLQNQIEADLARLWPDPALRAQKAVMRKGRENYLCLLNLEDALRGREARPLDAVALGLMTRWAAATRDGDLTGGDLPGWLPDLLGRSRTLALADKRGECVYAGCPHYHRCFIERSVRAARHADIVIANHALVLHTAAALQPGMGSEGEDSPTAPLRVVFDEGHHVFDAADSAFAVHLNGREMAELRRWLTGSETGRSSRARGLKKRLEDVIQGDNVAQELIAAIQIATQCLPADGWLNRLNDRLSESSAPENADSGNAAESWLIAVRSQIYTRTPDKTSPYSLECEIAPALPEMLMAANRLDNALGRLATPCQALAARLRKTLNDKAAELDSETRRRLDAAANSLLRRGVQTVAAWRAMLKAMAQETPPEFRDWLAIERIDGRDMDVGMYRHWLDPTVPLAATVWQNAHGAVVTSATLTDGPDEMGWNTAEILSGALHLPRPPERFRAESPYDYAANSLFLVVKDVRKDDMDAVASAYRVLFEAAEGGALGLFTAVSRLRAVRDRIAGPLEEIGLNLYAQHCDGIGVAALVEIMKAETHACLLGTDAIRDGVDVPGEALRLIVFDRLPWPRPDLLHKARRDVMGGKAHDERIARARLRQAFGRLIRKRDDRGVFVLLDSMSPSRILSALPDGVTVERVSLSEAVAKLKDFYGT